MSDKNNPPPAKIDTGAHPVTPFGPKAQAIKELTDALVKKPIENFVPAKSLLTIKIENDDLAYFLNGRYSDGGVASSQVSLHTSGEILPDSKIGKSAFGTALTGSSYIFGISASTSTAWDAENRKDYDYTQFEYAGANGNSRLVDDGKQLPTSEKYSVEAGIIKPITLSPTKQLDVGLRTDLSYNSGTPYVQNPWHQLTTNYWRDQKNTSRNQLFINTEVTGALHLTKDTAKIHQDVTLMGGASLGGGYRGVMTGAEVSIGSSNSKYFSQTLHSAMFANTNPDHVVSGGVAKQGDWKISTYAKIYVSDKKDYRLTMSNSAMRPVSGTTENVVQTLNDKSYQTLITPDESNLKESVYAIVQGYDETRVPIHYTVEQRTVRYDFKPVNIEIGAHAQIQLSKSVNLGAEIGFLTNPSKPIQNPGYQKSLEKLAQEYVNTPHVEVIINKDDPKASYTAQKFRTQEEALENAERIANIKPIAPSPIGNFIGTVSVNIALGSNKKKDAGRAH